MTRQALYEAVATWIKTIHPNAAIFRAFQDAQAPTTGTFISIDDSTSWDKFGEVTTGAVAVTAPAPALGSRQLKNDYTVVVGLWEIRGDGELLQGLLDNLDTVVTKAYFYGKAIGILSVSAIQQLNETLDSARNVKRSRVELTLSVTRENTEQVTPIEDVEIAGPAIT